MWPFKTRIERLTAADIQSLVPDIRENERLDYKRLIPSHNDQSTREMLKDVISLANATGGHIIIGISELETENAPDGTPTSVDGIVHADQEQEWVEQICHACIRPPIIGLRARDILIAHDRACVVVFVPNSMNKPHMYEHKGRREFYVRHGRLNLPMTIDEIRASVLSSQHTYEEHAQYVDRQHKSAWQFGRGRLSVWFYAAPMIVRTERIDIDSERVAQLFSSLPKVQALEVPVSLRRPMPLVDGLEAIDTGEEETSRLRVLASGFTDFVECVFDFEPERRFNHCTFEKFAYWWSRFSSVFAEEYLAGETLLLGARIFNADKTFMKIEGSLASRRGEMPRIIAESELILPELRITSEEEWRTAAMRLAKSVYRAYGHWSEPNFDPSGQLRYLPGQPDTVYGWEPVR